MKQQLIKNKLLSGNHKQRLKAKWSFIIPGSLLILGFILLSIYSLAGDNWAEVFATISMVMLSSFSVGALIGFIFGIPRTLQEDKTEGVKSNSNLEQLSDWLTKIIVGVGLVESKQVFELIGSLASKLSEGFSNSPMGYTIIGSTLVFYFFGGFFISYIWSRILLERIFQENIDTEKRISALEETKGSDNQLKELQFNYNKEEATEIIDKSLKENKSSKELSKIFSNVIGIAYEKLDYSTINELANAYDTKIQISAQTWSDIALANLNLYNTSRNKIYSDSVHLAIKRSIGLLHDYGIPLMVKIYLYLIEYTDGLEGQDSEQTTSAKVNIEEIVNDILSKNTITAYEAYSYMLRNDNTGFSGYNETFKKEFKSQYEALKDKYLKHLPS